VKRTGARPFDIDENTGGAVPGEPGGPDSIADARAAPALPRSIADRESILQGIVALAAQALDAPIAFASYPVSGRQIIRAQAGIDGLLRPADSLLPAALLDEGGIVVADLHAPEWQGLAPAVEMLGARVAIIVPIPDPGAGDAGRLCVFDTKARHAPPDERELRMLEGLAMLAGAERARSRPRADLAQRTSEARLDNVFSQAMVGILHRDLDGRVLMANDRFCEMVGRSAAELDRLPANVVIHPDDFPRGEEYFHAHRPAGTPYQVELRYVRPDGSEIWCASHTSFVRDEMGTIQSIVTVAQDTTRRRKAELALRESREHHRHSVELNPQLQWTARPDGAIEEVGPLWSSLTGSTAEEARGDGWIAALHCEDVAPTIELWQRAIRLREPVDIEYRLRCADGYRWMRARAAPRCAADGAIIRWYGTLEDIHDRRTAQQALAESEERFRLAVQAARLGIWDYDTVTGDRRWSEELLEMLGLPADATPNLAAALEIVHPDDRQKFQSIVAQAADGMAPVGFEVALRIRRASDGAPRWLKSTGWTTVSSSGGAGSGDMSRLIVTFQDVTEERDAEERIRWAATHDPLTMLPNRLALQEELESAIALAGPAGERVALLLLDVDNLKRINDTLGHDAGDALLRTFASRLADIAPGNATVGRLGGDEFAIVIPAVGGEEDAERCATALIESLRAPFSFHGRALDCGASIGASIYPSHGTNPTELLKSADLALYAAKTAGRGRTAMFRAAMRSDLQRQFSMINLAKDALANQRIDAFYQPKIDLRTHRLVGFEALLRWGDARGGAHLPAEIRAAFDDPDLAIEITDRMLERVTADLRHWLDRGFDPICVAVNTSANDFRYDNFAERVLASLAARRLPAHWLEIEVTETVFLGRGAQYVDRALRMLSAAGIRIALDDFGTGYASLSHLKQYPVDILKIDRSFVSNLENSPDDAAIADAVIDLGRNLGITIVAEGVETQAQADHLRERGCAVGQGYLFGRPVAAASIFPAWSEGLYRP
jgi:diguanylate cyclase (GGDEF)-like protein/PAS domain S-box-containing protein